MVFYNGRDEKEDETVLSLSSAFKAEIRRNVTDKRSRTGQSLEEASVTVEIEQIFCQADPDIEVRVRMLNINLGHNKALLSGCRPLGEYAWFVAQIRKYTASGADSEDAVDWAVDSMPDSFEIKQFLTANRAEVKDMCLTEYNEMKTMEMLRQEGLKEGRQEGQLETMLLNITNLMETTEWTIDKIMEMLKIPAEQRSSTHNEKLTKKNSPV